MYVKNIKLTNYRNFESLNGDLGLDFGRRTTLLIGKNGAGKTNLITALKQSLSFMFSKNQKGLHGNFIADSMQAIRSFETTDATRKFNPLGRQNQIGQWPIKIETTIDIGESINVVFQRDDLSVGMREYYSKAFVHFWEKYADLNDLPVIAFYSDSFPHEKVRAGKKIQDMLNSEFGISRPAGYYNWDDPRDCRDVWQQYFSQQWKNFRYGHNYNNEESYLRLVNDCMVNFSLPLVDAESNDEFELNEVTVVARGKTEIVMLRFKNGMESDFDSLPAGYRRAFSMVFDLANRAFLLNGNCDPEGVAFIDEIDLHLHPSLAQEILERMQRTFPRMQFIISTHSPLVLSNFKPEIGEYVIYRLQRENDQSTSIQRVDFAYGIDYNNLLVDLMGTKVRNTLLRQLIQSYLYWREVKDEDLMRSTLDEIKDLVGEDSRIIMKLTR